MKKIEKNIAIWWIGLISVIGILGGYCITIGFRGMPPAEGWYTWYSELINQDKVVYKDFSYLFYPFYIQFIALFCKVFGYSIVTLRVLGVVIFCGIGAASYLIFSKLTSVVGAVFAAITTTMFIQSEVVQVFYDYIRFMDLFAYLAVYFLICYMQQIKMRERYGWISLAIIFSGVFATLACMTKQSTGTLLIVYTIILLLFISIVLRDYIDFKRVLFDTVGYIATVAILFCIMIVWLYNKGALETFFSNATSNALDAKGGLLTVLFRWIIENMTAMIKQTPIVLCFLMMILAIWLISSITIKAHKDTVSIEILACKKVNQLSEYYSANKYTDLKFILFGSAFLGMVIVACRKIPFLSKVVVRAFTPKMAVFGFVLCSLCFFVSGIYFLVSFVKKKKEPNDYSGEFKYILLPWFALLGGIFAIGYGVGISGGLAESQTALAIGVSVAMFSAALENKKIRTKGIVVLILASTLFSTSCAARKYMNLYSWWGLTEGSVWEAQYMVDHPMLKGIKMNINEYEMYTGIVETINNETNKNDTIFCFPHIPIFYALTDRCSSTYTQVQWFDMSNINDIRMDIQRLEKENPKAIIYCDMPEYVYKSHESRFNHNEKSQTRVMAEFLMDFVEKKSYKKVNEFTVCEGYSIRIYIDK